MVICYNLRQIQMHHMHQPERKNFRSTIYEIDEPMRSWRVLTGAACTACSETCDNTTELCVYTLNVCTTPNIPLRCLYPSTCLAALLAQSLMQRLATARRTRYDDGTGACPGDVNVGYSAQPIIIRTVHYKHRGPTLTDQTSCTYMMRPLLSIFIPVCL